MEDFNQESKSAPIMPSALRYGLIGGLLTIIWGIASIFLGWSDPGAGKSFLSTGIVWIINIAMLVMVMIYHRDTMQNGFLSFGEGFKVGLTTMVIMGIIGGLFQLIYTQFIDPDLMQGILQSAQEKMEEDGMSDEQIDAAMKWTKMLSSPAMMVPFVILSKAIFGVIFSLIISAIVKNENPFS